MRSAFVKYASLSIMNLTWQAVIGMPQLNNSNNEVSPQLNKSKIGFHGAGGVKISQGREVGGQIQEFRNSGIVNYKKFEELPCWQKARELCQAVFSRK